MRKVPRPTSAQPKKHPRETPEPSKPSTTHKPPKTLHAIARTRDLLKILTDEAVNEPIRMERLKTDLRGGAPEAREPDEKTIRRYIQWLQADGHAIEYVHGQGWQLDLIGSRAKSDLGKIEREALRQSALALKTLRDLGFEAPGGWRTARVEVEEQLLPADRQALSLLFTRFRVEPWPRRAVPPELDKFAEALRLRVRLRLEYRPMTTKQWGTYTIDPCLLRWIGDRWELLAFDPRVDDIRTFLPSRARNVEVLRDEPAKPHTEQLNRCMREIFRTARGRKDAPAMDVVVRFEPHAAQFLEGAKFHVSQKTEHLPDGAMVVRLRVTTLHEVVSWLLGFGRSALVLAPPELRLAMKQELRAALARYGGKSS